jgi:pimeloyl-ACP methyl ester carboxylesterase
MPTGVVRDTLANGAEAKIAFPAHWNGELVLHADGYLPPGGVPPDEDAFRTQILARGFALAEPKYRDGFWAMDAKLRDLELLRDRFEKRFGVPGRTYLVGHSEGGFRVLASLELHPRAYAGGLALCPLASPSFLDDPLVDLLVAFDFYFPGVLTRGDSLVSRIPTPRPGAIAAALNADPSHAGGLARRFDVHADELSDVIRYYAEILQELQREAHGNPAGNRTRRYQGFEDDASFNRMVHRFDADTAAARRLREHIYPLTGKLSAPALIAHTSHDDIIPVRTLREYESLATRASASQHLVIDHLPGSGHCAFTLSQQAAAFDRLVRWVRTGRRPPSGAVGDSPLAVKRIGDPSELDGVWTRTQWIEDGVARPAFTEGYTAIWRDGVLSLFKDGKLQLAHRFMVDSRQSPKQLAFVDAIGDPEQFDIYELRGNELWMTRFSDPANWLARPRTFTPTGQTVVVWRRENGH